MQVDVSETGSDISKEKLSYYDVLLFNNANVLDKVFNEDQRNAIEEWYKDGEQLLVCMRCWCIRKIGPG